MNNFLREKEDFQRYVIERLVRDDGYVERKADRFDRVFACDRELLFRFLDETQPEATEALRKIYKDQYEETVVGLINAEATKSTGGLLELFKRGVEIARVTLRLAFVKPATSFNKELVALYEKNIFSVMEEVRASDSERVDLVVFLNGLAIFAFELKSEASGRSYRDAIEQYRNDREPTTRLFLFKAGVLVCFALDTSEIYTTTKLEKTATTFLPFNKGRGEGVDAGKGNPISEDDFAVSYLWKDVLQKDSVLDLITKFIFVQKKETRNDVTDKIETKETVVFPRYHQWDAIRKLLASVRKNGSSLNYLIQHSAGSGKTNTIAWLAYRLASLHDANDRIIFDAVVVVTDRRVVDAQLQKAILGLERKSGLFRPMNEECNSADLARALQGNAKIIATTIQKFPHIVEIVKNLNKKRFAVIIDEAHSSTSGKEMGSMTKAFGSGDDEDPEPTDDEDKICAEIRKYGKRPNASIFAFTATPKAATLQLFGRRSAQGAFEAFHLYSMKQAIEEGFILDVLRNYATYKTYFQISKTIENDPKFKTTEAKRQIARFVDLHETNVAQRVEIIVEHFRSVVAGEIGGLAKAMVVTKSRRAAVQYYRALQDYVAAKKYKDVRPLVAFAGSVRLKDDETEYSEGALNGFSEDKLPDRFDDARLGYNVLLVANKYQTGFDQPKLCALYVMKKLNGTAAVQTLSRLNRVCRPFPKKTFVLDFDNSYDEMKKAFAPYFTATRLVESITPSKIYEVEANVDAYYILDPDDVEKGADLLLKRPIASKEKKKLDFYFQKAKAKAAEKDRETRIAFVLELRKFVRFYEFLIQASRFEDVDLHRKYIFIDHLLSYLDVAGPGGGFSLEGKIKAFNFVQKKISEHSEPNLISQPSVKLPIAKGIGLTKGKEERLSRIVEEINLLAGKNFERNETVLMLMQLGERLKNSKTLQTSARNNSQKEFELAFYEEADEALCDGAERNEAFFNLLLSNEELKKKTLDAFVPDVYRSCRAK